MRKQLQMIVAFLAGVLITSAASAVAANSGHHHHQGQIYNLKANDSAVFGTLVCQAFGPAFDAPKKDKEKEFWCAETPSGTGEYTVYYGTKTVVVDKNSYPVFTAGQHD